MDSVSGVGGGAEDSVLIMASLAPLGAVVVVGAELLLGGLVGTPGSGPGTVGTAAGVSVGEWADAGVGSAGAGPEVGVAAVGLVLGLPVVPPSGMPA